MADQHDNTVATAAALAAEKLAMLQFVDRGQAYPPKRSAEDRADDFEEISDKFDGSAAQAQSAPARNAACPIARPIARCIITFRTGCA
jgi:glutamate synthase (NADPH/NADH) small chain